MKPYDPEAYTPDLLAHWIGEGERQAAKDRVLVPRIAELLGPGRVARARFWRRTADRAPA
jgi:hypothetical protein